MVYQSFLYLFNGEGDLREALRCGLIAAAIVLKFLLHVISLSFSHAGTFNIL
jgi:hypothetical protein